MAILPAVGILQYTQDCQEQEVKQTSQRPHHQKTLAHHQDHHLDFGTIIRVISKAQENSPEANNG